VAGPKLPRSGRVERRGRRHPGICRLPKSGNGGSSGGQKKKTDRARKSPPAQSPARESTHNREREFAAQQQAAKGAKSCDGGDLHQITSSNNSRRRTGCKRESRGTSTGKGSTATKRGSCRFEDVPTSVLHAAGADCRWPGHVEHLGWRREEGERGTGAAITFEWTLLHAAIRAARRSCVVQQLNRPGASFPALPLPRTLDDFWRSRVGTASPLRPPLRGL
jgi:hypothetical protein